MDSSINPHAGITRSHHHKVWTKCGRKVHPSEVRPLQSGLGSPCDVCEFSYAFPTLFQDSSVAGSNDESAHDLCNLGQQESLLSQAGDLDRILHLVSSFWDKLDESQVVTMSSFDSSNSSSTDRPPQSAGDSRSSPSSESAPNNILHQQESPARIAPPPGISSHNVNLPQSVRMITHSNEIPCPDLPTQSNTSHVMNTISESPLALLRAASGGTLDLHWLESFDNASLESLVPRDAHSGRPLTIGSIEHSEGKCRPCIFFLKAKCFKGLRCSFCHFNHTALRKQVFPDSDSTHPGLMDVQTLLKTSGSMNKLGGSGDQPSTKSKRLRPSKRTREMIKDINEQMMFDNIPEDLNGPPLSISQTIGPQSVAPTVSNLL